MDHVEYAGKLFTEGYNCAQSVMVAFCDVTGLSEDFAAQAACAFGAGMGRMREVCGAVSGMLMVTGLLYGYSDPKDTVTKRELYKLEQELAGKFREAAGSIVCRDLLKNASTDPNPAARTAEYYKVRPCCRMVMLAASILDEYLQAHPPVRKDG